MQNIKQGVGLYGGVKRNIIIWKLCEIKHRLIEFVPALLFENHFRYFHETLHKYEAP